MNTTATPTLKLSGAVRDLIQVDLSDDVLKHTLPRLARDSGAMAIIEEAVLGVPTKHDLRLGDARNLGFLDDNSVHLALTSPPYWTLKEYASSASQLGEVQDYDEFVEQIATVWRECYRVLAPGGRLVVVVGDVCLSRRRNGRHAVVPLHASIQESCRMIGFDNLAPIIWHKIANAKFEAGGSGGFLGKPYEPNAVIKNDIEYILMQRKPGGYRKPTLEKRMMSVIGEPQHRAWFQQVWTLPGASTRHHPAPYPVTLAERLIRMFSFVGDTVVDPFLGSGTTSIAAGRWGRHSVGVEVEATYLDLSRRRLKEEFGLLRKAEVAVTT
jgi:DNA modification methylase